MKSSTSSSLLHSSPGSHSSATERGHAGGWEEESLAVRQLWPAVLRGRQIIGIDCRRLARIGALDANIAATLRPQQRADAGHPRELMQNTSSDIARGKRDRALHVWCR